MMFETKDQARKYILQKRDEINPHIKIQWDNKIFTTFINSKFYKESKTIFSFVSFRSEVDTHRIIKYAIEDKKTVCVPKISSREKGMEVYRIDGFHDLREGYYKILEPIEGCEKVLPEDIDLILMPGAAFDREGGRIGYGAGYYDRFLRNMGKNIPKIALSYDFQLFDKIPTDEFDVKIDGIITNEHMIIFE